MTLMFVVKHRRLEVMIKENFKLAEVILHRPSTRVEFDFS
jgi:hypothetical protein